MALKPVTGSDADTVALVITEAQALAEELRPGRAPRVHAASDLDRDLQLDSLARAELLLRLERAFGIDLPDQLLASSETLQDLADAVMLSAETSVGRYPAEAVCQMRRIAVHTEAFDARLKDAALLKVLKGRLMV